MIGSKYIGYIILAILMLAITVPLLTSIVKIVVFAAVIAGIIWIACRVKRKGKLS